MTKRIVHDPPSWRSARAACRYPGDTITVITVRDTPDLVYTVNERGQLTGPTLQYSHLKEESRDAHRLPKESDRGY